MISRLDEIRNQLRSDGRIQVSDLCTRFQVSAVTIRKDLALLEDEGFAKRIYGGALLADDAPSLLDDPSVDPVHMALAELACMEIEDGDSIFLGSGRTCCCLAKLFPRFHNLSVVTNNITALNDLTSNGMTRVYLLGGEVTSVDGRTLFSSPEDPRSFVDNVSVNKAFTSISGVDLRAGLTVNSVISTYIYRMLPSLARTWYLMADQGKFDKISIYPVAELDAIDCLITDRLPPQYQQPLEQSNIRVRQILQAH